MSSYIKRQYKLNNILGNQYGKNYKALNTNIEACSIDHIILPLIVKGSRAVVKGKFPFVPLQFNDVK